MQDIEDALVSGKPTDIWGSYNYCMELTEQRTIKGREKALEKGSAQDARAFISALFADDAAQTGRSLAAVLRDVDITVQTEPGVALLDHCGVTLMRVLGTKTAANGAELVLVDGNIYNLSVAKIYQYIADPLLIGEGEADDVPYGAYIAGNLCQENDILMKRKIPFARKPRAGDVLCFANTAPYFSAFEDASPHMHPRGASFVATERSSGWSLVPERLYQPSLVQHAV
jgi:diaminopimelate decarboxylase